MGATEGRETRSIGCVSPSRATVEVLRLRRLMPARPPARGAAHAVREGQLPGRPRDYALPMRLQGAPCRKRRTLWAIFFHGSSADSCRCRRE